MVDMSVHYRRAMSGCGSPGATVVLVKMVVRGRSVPCPLPLEFISSPTPGTTTDHDNDSSKIHNKQTNKQTNGRVNYKKHIQREQSVVGKLGN